jgi:hypothetical protein
MDDTDAGADAAAPVWAVFGDLMAGLLGAFVLILVCALGLQVETGHAVAGRGEEAPGRSATARGT